MYFMLARMHVTFPFISSQSHGKPAHANLLSADNYLKVQKFSNAKLKLLCFFDIFHIIFFIVAVKSIYKATVEAETLAYATNKAG